MLDSQTGAKRKKDATKLARAIQSWLDFQILCGREFLLSEAYLGQPIADFLSGRHNGEVVAEGNHPIFQQERGRPQQIDYILKSPNENHDNAAIEVKWLGLDGEESNKKISRRRVFNDILRLEILRGHQTNSVYRYFLVAGGNESFNEGLFGMNFTGEGEFNLFAKQFLPIANRDEVRVNFQEVNDGFVKFFGYYADQYASQEKLDEDLMPSRKFDVRRVADENGTHTRVMMWRVITPGHVNSVDLTQRKECIPGHLRESIPGL